MTLGEMRKSRGLTQKQLSQMTGINYRSLQDYEQGHKKLSSASGDVLLRLSTALGYSMEELVLKTNIDGAPLHAKNRLAPSYIHNQTFYCEKYQTPGKWLYLDQKISILFFYDGMRYNIPFSAVFTPELLPWLKDAACLMIEAKIEEIEFEKTFPKGE